LSPPNLLISGGRRPSYLSPVWSGPVPMGQTGNLARWIDIDPLSLPISRILAKIANTLLYWFDSSLPIPCLTPYPSSTRWWRPKTFWDRTVYATERPLWDTYDQPYLQSMSQARQSTNQ